MGVYGGLSTTWFEGWLQCLVEETYILLGWVKEIWNGEDLGLAIIPKVGVDEDEVTKCIWALIWGWASV